MAAMDLWHIERKCSVTLSWPSWQASIPDSAQFLACAGSDKLSMYGFHIHACIDCGSAFAVYAASDLNPEPDTMFDLFTEALTVFGHPSPHPGAPWC